MNSLRSRSILLGVTGSIAAYKACELIRRLQDLGAEVWCAMTPGAQKFISPLSLGALSGHPVALDVWDPSLWEMSHIRLAEKADLFMIAPASAQTLSQLACGASSNIVTSIALATHAPILIAPAMHEGMWLHPATQENVKKLKDFGYDFIGPEHGKLLGKQGWGRFSDPDSICSAAETILSRKQKNNRRSKNLSK